MAKLKGSVNKKARYAVYAKGSYAKNRKAKLEKHLKAHPEDVQAQKALKNITDKPRRSVHVASGLPVFKEITEKTVIKGKPTTIVVSKIRLSRLDLQLKRQVRKAQNIKRKPDETEKLFAALSFAQSVNVLNEHTKRLYEERIAKLKAEGKFVEEKGKKDKKDKNGKPSKQNTQNKQNKSGKGKPSKSPKSTNN